MTVGVLMLVLMLVKDVSSFRVHAASAGKQQLCESVVKNVVVYHYYTLVDGIVEYKPCLRCSRNPSAVDTPYIQSTLRRPKAPLSQ